uniref:Salivary inositol polyphosphate 5-phosphatase n=1 Tax=Triatoma infestans TaxID=30076 RepID=A6YPP4_TRIIF|nr:salivary inositol polyphosphate 5-phosphatase [Triatoma infestans]
MNLKILLSFSFVSVVSIHAKDANLEPRTVYAVTWNAGEEEPPPSLTELLGQISSYDVNPDIVIIGLQEMTMNPTSALLKKNKWTKEIDKVLESNNNYVKVKSESLLGMLLNVYVKVSINKNWNKKKTMTIMTGKGGKFGNKGAVIVTFQLNNQWFCIVNSHLPAHDGKQPERIKDYKLIDAKREKFCKKPSDYIFWLGDLNFRLMDETNYNADKILGLINQNKFGDLLQKDELTDSKNKGSVFTGFTEESIKFAPTFKLKKGKGEYKLERRPAWTDRVLYKSETSKKITPTLYKSVTSYKGSDHYPVQAQFSINNK